SMHATCTIVRRALFERTTNDPRPCNAEARTAASGWLGITIYQTGRIGRFRGTRGDLRPPAREPVPHVPQDPLVPGHVHRPPRPRRFADVFPRNERAHLPRRHPDASHRVPLPVLVRAAEWPALRGE